MFLPWLAILEAVRRTQRDLNEMEGILPKVRGRSRAAKTGRAAKFAAYRDPAGKFELRYPTEWDLQTGHGVLVRSPRIATFANVEVLPTADAPWRELEVAAAKLGGELEVTRRSAGPPRHLRGKLQLGPTRYAMNAWAHVVAGELVVLSTGNVVDADRATKIERYEDKVLDAIRREFRAPAPVAPER